MDKFIATLQQNWIFTCYGRTVTVEVLFSKLELYMVKPINR